MLKTVAFIKGQKWTSIMIKRVYFGNWLRDYSQAVDVGSLKGVQAGTIRILVWVLSFLSFGYATGEFEVTEERLGVYRPEEHIDNPRDYADNLDARQYDARLRPPVQPIELQVDPETGMKNYIANENLGIATSSGYIKHSFSRSIHFGRVYTNGAGGTKGKEADLCEALRCLGQALHCMEDFGAHTNYTELALREVGYNNVFPHTGTGTEINLRGHRVYPLVTGTFGAVDFVLSVLGEAGDHFAQTEIDEMDIALGDAQTQTKRSEDASARAFGGPGQQVSYLTGLLSQVPGAQPLCEQAKQLQAQSEAQEQSLSSSRGFGDNNTYGDTRSTQPTFEGPPGSTGGPPGPGIPGMSPNFDPIKTAAQIYPILEFRDKVVRLISATIEKIPGLEALVEKITETLTLFILSLLAPFIRPIVAAVSKQVKAGGSTLVDASGKHQYEPWTDPHCTDPTHSLLSKDHFSNVLNEPAGQVATVILQYVAPRIIYAWQHPDIHIDQVLNDVVRVFHHPAIRDPHCEIHRTMFETVERWAHSQPNRGANLNNILSSESVRQGKNQLGDAGNDGHSHGIGGNFGSGTHSKVKGAPWEKLTKMSQTAGLSRDNVDLEDTADTLGATYPGTETGYDATRPPTGPGTEYQYPSQPYSEPPYGQNPYSHPSFPNKQPPQQPFNAYDTAPAQYQQGYGQAYGGPSASGPYPPQAYPPGPPYGQGPNEPQSLPPGAYEYGGQPSQQGGQYYGGGSYQ